MNLPQNPPAVPISFSAGARLSDFQRAVEVSSLEFKLSASIEGGYSRAEETQRRSHTIFHIGPLGSSKELISITAFGSDEISCAVYRVQKGYSPIKAAKFIDALRRAYHTRKQIS